MNSAAKYPILVPMLFINTNTASIVKNTEVSSKNGTSDFARAVRMQSEELRHEGHSIREPRMSTFRIRAGTESAPDRCRVFGADPLGNRFGAKRRPGMRGLQSERRQTQPQFPPPL